MPKNSIADCPGGGAPAGSTVYSAFSVILVCKPDGAYLMQTNRWLTPEGYTCDVTTETRDSILDGRCGITPDDPPLDTPVDTPLVPSETLH